MENSIFAPQSLSMKNVIFWCLLLLSFVSCSKKVEVKGKIANANPLERIEIIEASGVGTLPLINMGLSPNGEFSGSFDAPRHGLYAITYAGNMNMLYLKKGQKLNISGSSADFPQKMTITGDAKPNNDFIQESQKNFETYASKIDLQSLVAKKEPEFLKDVKKIRTDLIASIDATAKKHNADAEAVSFKKKDIDARLLGVMDSFENFNGQMAGNPTFKVSKAFQDLKNEIAGDHDTMIAEIPAYRDYTLNRLNGDFQKFVQTQSTGPETLISEIFGKFLKTKNDLSKVTKDYLFAYVIAQSDINFNNFKRYDHITKLIDENISDSKIKSDLKQLQTVLMGFKSGAEPQLKLIDKNGKNSNLSDLKGKPTLVTFYSSWNPNISLVTVPVLRDVTNFYKSKLNFAYVNLDDTKEQFQKTSAAMFGKFPGANYWAEGGINAEQVRKFGLYSFKTPSYILLDKNGKTVGRPYFNLGDPDLVLELDKITGLKAPQVQQTPEEMFIPPGSEPTPPPHNSDTATAR